MVECQLPNSASMDCFQNLGHNSLVASPEVIAQVIKYLKNLDAVPLGNCPSTQELLQDADVQTVATGNQGYIFRDEQHSHSISVDPSAQQLTATVSFSNCRLGLTMFSSDGIEMIPNSYPVIYSTNTDNSATYAIDLPSSGVWTARVDSIDVPESGVSYSFVATLSSSYDLNVGIETTGPFITTDQSLLIWADFFDGTNAVVGATVTAVIANPLGDTNSLTFFDDGTNGDLVEDDGIYALEYTPNLLGPYEVLIKGNYGLVQRIGSLHFNSQPSLEIPILEVESNSSEVEISWISPVGAYLLEETPNLLYPSWYAVDVVPELDTNYVHSATVATRTNQCYYRLIAQ